MKKIVLIILSFTVLTILLNANESFHSYRENPSKENLINLINELKTDDEVNYGSEILLANVFLMEIEKSLTNFEANLDSLGMGERFQYANLLLALNRNDDAIAIYNNINEAAPNWSCPWRHKGEAYLNQNELEKSETALLKAIETRVEHYDAYVMLADVQSRMDKPDVALKTLETGFTYLGKDIEDPSEEVDDKDVQFLYLKLLKINKNEKFDKVFDRVKKLYPEEPRLSDFE